MAASSKPAQRAQEQARERRYLRGPQQRLFELIQALRIFREYFKGLRTLHFAGPCVTVFGSARLDATDPAYELARQCGELLAKAEYTVMTGGGPGIMEAANRGAYEAGGKSIGCNIQLPHEQLPNRFTTLSITFRHFFIRKVMLVKYSVGFVAVAGGLGTFDELFEVTTLAQTGKIENFPIVLLGKDFWDPVVGVLRQDLLGRHTIAEGDLRHLHVTDSPEDAVRHIRAVAGHLGRKRRRPKRHWWLGE